MLVGVVVAADAGRGGVRRRAEGVGSAWERGERVVGGGPHWMGAGGCGGKFGCPPKMGAAVGALLELGFCPPALKIG